MSVPKVGDPVWHIHHDALVEPLTEPLENRIKFIKERKPAREIETRLRLMKPVRGKLPELAKAYAEWAKAYAKWVKADAELAKAYAEWAKAYAAPSVLALHAKECPNCPWNGETIFPPAEQEGT